MLQPSDASKHTDARRCLMQPQALAMHRHSVSSAHACLSKLSFLGKQVGRLSLSGGIHSVLTGRAASARGPARTRGAGGDAAVAVHLAPLPLHVAHQQVRRRQEVDGSLARRAREDAARSQRALRLIRACDARECTAAGGQRSTQEARTMRTASASCQYWIAQVSGMAVACDATLMRSSAQSRMRRTSASDRPRTHSVGPQSAGNVSSSRSCRPLTSAAAARAPSSSAGPAPLRGRQATLDAHRQAVSGVGA